MIDERTLNGETLVRASASGVHGSACNVRCSASRPRTPDTRHPTPGTRHNPPDTLYPPARAFTLIEVLLVLAIVAVLTAVTMPQFVRSIRGQRLSAAARTVVLAGRYARTMAIVRQEGLRLSFGSGVNGATVSVGDELSRVLDRVQVEHVRREDTQEDMVAVEYQSNGRCTPYEVRLVSDDEEALTIRVDGLGSARIETEQGT